MSFQINTSITKTTTKINSAQINSEIAGTLKVSQLLTIPILETGNITAQYGVDGSLVYDSTVNQFKIRWIYFYNYFICSNNFMNTFLQGFFYSSFVL